MKKNLLYVVLVLIVFTIPFRSDATHVTGGDITYTCIGPNQYLVTMSLFRDCSGSTLTTTVGLTLTNDCGLGNPALTLTLQNPLGGNCTSGIAADCASEVSQLCSSQMINSTCNGGTLPGMEEYVYTGIVTLPGACDSWTFAYNLCCRNTTVNVSGQPNFEIETTMNSQTDGCNNSPVCTSQPIPYVCVNQPVAYNYGVVEVDGDSLAFSLVNALQSVGTSVPYNGGYSGGVPIPGITINSATGQINFTPTLLGNFVVTILVEEYSNGVLIGTVMRDQQFVVQNCSNIVPNAASGTISGFSGTGVQTGPYSVELCEGDNFAFNAVFTDPNAADILTLLSNITSVLPGSTFTTSGNGPITASVTWTAPVGSAGTNTSFFITVNDGACPVPGAQTMIYDINVLARTSAGPDEYYCPGGVTIQLNAIGGTVFTWAPATGLSCSNCPSPIATPSVTTTYIVTSNLSNNCINKDTITVFVVPDFIPSISPVTSTICKYGSVQLNAGGDPTGAPYNVTWTPATGLSCTNCPNPVASPLTSTGYMATVVAASGCTVELNTMVNVVGVAPNIIASAVDTTVCAGSGTQLSTIIYPDVCTTTTLACTGSSNTGTIGTGISSTSTYSPFYLFANPTTYSNRKQYLFTAVELNAMGFVGGGKITSIALNYTTAGSSTPGMVIKMGCTDIPMFPDGNFIPGLSVVKTAFTSTPSIGWNTYTFTNPYLWDGTSNLIVEFCLDNLESGTTANVQYGTYGTNYYMIYYNSTVAGACSYATGFRTTARPNMQFTFCAANPPVTYSWTPGTGLSSTTSPSPTATPGSTITYTVSATDAGCVGTDQITIYIVPDFNVTMSPASATICLNNDVQLNATPSVAGTYTYNWTPAAGLSCTTCANPIASPAATTTYTCDVTSAAGCTNTATVSVTISGSAPNVMATVLDNTVCQGGNTQLGTIIYPDLCTTTALACTGPANSATVGTAVTSTSTYGPSYTSATAYGNRKLYLYTAAELTAAGFVGGGKITAVALNYATVGTALTNVQIKMGCTSLTQFPDGNFIPGLTTVKTAFTLTPVMGWNTFTLTSPYIWDGTSNLLVEFCVDAAQTGTASNVMYSSTSPNYYHIYYNTTLATGSCTFATGTRTTVRPNMQFSFCPAVPAYTYSWTPTTGVSNPTSSSTTVTPTGNTTYQVNVTNGGCAGVSTVAVNVVPTFSLTMSPNSTICQNNTYQLSATPSVAGTYTYSWSPSTGLSNPAISNPVASPASTTVYTVSVTSAAGCTITGTVTVTVSGIAPNLAIGGDNLICPNVPNTLTALVYPASCTTTALACTGSTQTITVGTGSSATTTYSPNYTSATAYGNRKLYLYTAAELNAMGFTGGGKITSIALKYTTVGTTLTGMVIKMGCTSLTQFPDATYVPGLTTVKTAFSQAPLAGWNSYTLTSPYLWDGVSNLLVEFCVDAAQTGTASSVEYTSTAPNYYHIYNNSTSVSGNCSVVTGIRTTVRPNMQFTFCPAVPSGSYTYAWSPSTGLSSTNTLSTTSTIGLPVTYSLTVTNGGCSSTATFPVNIDNTNSVTITPNPDTSVCPPNTIQLNALFTGPMQQVFLPSCGTNGTSCTQTQYYSTVGAGVTSSTAYSPFYQSYNDHKNQYLIRASELTAAGITSGTIRELAWNVITKSSTLPYTGFTIALGCTNETTLSTAVGWLPATTVWTGNYSSVAGWNNFVLTSPFDWDGVSNIVIQTCYNNPNGAGGFSVSDATQYSAPGYTCIMYDYASANGTNGCGLPSTYSSTGRPNMRFRVCPPQPPALTYSWTGNVSNNSIANPTTLPVSTSTYSVIVTGGFCTVYDTATIYVCQIPLSVELLSFTGRNAGAVNILNWITQSEINNDYYTIERSSDGNSFLPIGTLDGAGNSNERLHYEFTDQHPYPGINYYRLKQTDFNSNDSYSNVISLKQAEEMSCSVSPNPAHDELLIEIKSPENGESKIELYDIAGRLLMSETLKVNKGNNSSVIDISLLSRGTYMLRIISEENTFLRMLKIIKE